MIELRGLVLFKEINLVEKGSINKVSDTSLKEIIEAVQTIENNNKYINILVKKIDNLMPTSMNRYMVINSNGVASWNGKAKFSLSDSDKNNDIEKMYDAIRTYQSTVGNTNKYNVEFDWVKNHDYEKISQEYENMIKENAFNLYKYYEYVQFKKAVFKCTKLHYDEQTGKVDELNFEFTGKIE